MPTCDGWIKIDEGNKLFNIKERARECFPTAHLYGITRLGGEEWLAIRCHMSEIPWHWPHKDVQCPDVLWDSNGVDYFCSITGTPKFKSRELLNKNTEYWEETEEDEQWFEEWQQKWIDEHGI